MAISLNQDQQQALFEITNFLQDSKQDVFILRGSAGTGKTTLISSLTKELEKLGINYGLLAPTGRAARILGSKTKQVASTIHRAIYSFDGLNVNEEAIDENDPGLDMYFPLKAEGLNNVLFIVDESSMVGDAENKEGNLKFGSGRLLKDLIQFCGLNTKSLTVKKTKLIFVGDAAQLPPVGENFSPALSAEYLQKNYNLNAMLYDLSKVMRQAEGSSILARATEIRDAIFKNTFNEFNLKPDQQEIEKVGVTVALNKIVESLQNKRSSVAVVYSNRTARDYNRSIRERIWGSANLAVQAGDTLLVNKSSTTHNLSNGDLVKVLDVSHLPEQATINLKVKGEGTQAVNLYFRKVTVAYRDANGEIIKLFCFILENLLDSLERGVTPLEQRALLVHFRQRHEGLSPKSNEFKQAIKQDPYFNALQVKYGYAMTCHKAQGGEWQQVIVDFDSSFSARNSNFFRWVYTAITRASKKLLVINPPNFTTTSDLNWGTRKVDVQQTEVNRICDFKSDPDWDKFSFNDSLTPLFSIHQQVRDTWKAQNIHIKQVKHMQFCERYTVERDGKQVDVQYHFNSKYKITNVNILPGLQININLAEETVSALKNISIQSQDNTTKAESFIEEFLDKIKSALSETDIELTNFATRDYCVRIGFNRGSHHAQIDFHYNGKKKWTRAQEVGGIGSSQGILETIQESMENEG